MKPPKSLTFILRDVSSAVVEWRLLDTSTVKSPARSLSPTVPLMPRNIH